MNVFGWQTVYKPDVQRREIVAVKGHNEAVALLERHLGSNWMTQVYAFGKSMDSREIELAEQQPGEILMRHIDQPQGWWGTVEIGTAPLEGGFPELKKAEAA